MALILSIESANEIISKINEVAKTMDEYEEVKNMSGVGNRLAPILIAEIGDIRRFKNASSLIAYAGIDAPPYQSGQFEAIHRHQIDTKLELSSIKQNDLSKSRFYVIMNMSRKLA